MVTIPTDAELIRASLGNPEAFSAVFERHHDVIRRYLERRLGSSAGEDLAAEVFVQALESRSRFDTSWTSARPWLFGIATNLLRHHTRSEHNRFRAYQREAVQTTTQEEPDLLDALDAARRVAEAANALDQLQTGDRDALLLFAWGEMSYREVAAALDIPVGTVRSRINRARRDLRELLGRSEATTDEGGERPSPRGGG